MHNSRKIFLTDKEPRCILTSYENVENAPTKEYKTYDTSIEAGDYVVIPTDTRHNMTVVKVEEVDVEADLDSDEPVSWVICKADRTEFERVTKVENTFLTGVRSAEKKRRKEQLRQDFLSDVDESAIAALEDQSAS